MATAARKHKVFFLAVKAVLLVLFCSNATEAIQPTVIKGTIYNTHTRSVVSGATIDTATGLSANASSGAFFLRVPPNVYDIIVSAPGFCSNILSGIPTSPGQTQTVDIWLTPASNQSGSIEGRVVSLQTRDAVSGAIAATDLGGITVTDEAGYFKMTTPSGLASVTFAARGFRTRTFDNISVLPNRTRRIVVYLETSPPGKVTVSGIIRNACTGSKITDARVVSSGSEIDYSSDGSYSLETASGESTLFFSAPGYQFAYRTVSLYAAQRALTLHIALVPSANGSGMVKGTVSGCLQHEPLEDVRFATDTGSISFSGENGTYAIYTSLCSSRVAAQKDGFKSTAFQISPSNANPFVADFCLEPLGTLTGTVSDAHDNHTINGAVLCLNELPDLCAVTEQDGCFLIENVPPDSYTLSVSHGCYASQNSHVTVELNDICKDDISLVPLATGTVQGYVSDRFSGRPVQYAGIESSHGSGTYADENGFYFMEVPACKTDFGFFADGYLTDTVDGIYVEENSTTDITHELTPCPFALVLAEYETAQRAEEMLAILRNFRDTKMYPGSALYRYRELFYSHAHAISSLLCKNDFLRRRFAYIVRNVTEIIAGGKLRPGGSLLKDAGDFMVELYGECDSRDLRLALARLLEDIRSLQKQDLRGIITE